MKSHFLVNVKEKNTICKLHNKKYNKYCLKCKINLCELCNNHNGHYIEHFKYIYPQDENITKYNEEVIGILDKFQEKENEIKESEKQIEEKEKEKIKYLQEELKKKETGKKEDIQDLDSKNENKQKDIDTKKEYTKIKDIKKEEIINKDIKYKDEKKEDEDIKDKDKLNEKGKEENQNNSGLSEENNQSDSGLSEEKNQNNSVLNEEENQNILSEEENQNNSGLNEEENQNNNVLSEEENKTNSQLSEEESLNYSYEKKYIKEKFEYLNQQRMIIKIKSLFINSFSNKISNFNYINNVNNIIRTTFKDKIRNYDFYNEYTNINYIDDIPEKGDINNIENKILIKSLSEENNNYYSIWCMKKLNDIEINSNQKLELIALGDSKYRILIINVLTFKFYQIIEENKGSIYSLEQYKNDPNYLFSSSEDGTINIYKLDENYKYKLIQKLKKSEEKDGSEINKVISLSNKLLVSGDHRSITIWKSNNEENSEINYEYFYEIIIDNDTCHLLEVNPLIFVATQYSNN